MMQQETYYAQNLDYTETNMNNVWNNQMHKLGQ